MYSLCTNYNQLGVLHIQPLSIANFSFISIKPSDFVFSNAWHVRWKGESVDHYQCLMSHNDKMFGTDSTTFIESGLPMQYIIIGQHMVFIFNIVYVSVEWIIVVMFLYTAHASEPPIKLAHFPNGNSSGNWSYRSLQRCGCCLICVNFHALDHHLRVSSTFASQSHLYYSSEPLPHRHK